MPYMFFLILLLILLGNKYNYIYGKALTGYNINPAEYENFRFVVCILSINNQFSLVQNIQCTGTLISLNHILLAEHCFDNIKSDPYRIIIGSNNLARGSSFYPAWWTSYDQWARSQNIRLVFAINDIGIIRLIGSIPSHFPTACLSMVTPNSLFYGLNAVLVGWGTTNEGHSTMILQTANVTILNNNACKRIISNLHGSSIPIHERHLCTKADPYVHLGFGDSGGPLLYENTIIAINKGTIPKLNGQFHPDILNVHVGINFYRSFINQLLEM